MNDNLGVMLLAFMLLSTSAAGLEVSTASVRQNSVRTIPSSIAPVLSSLSQDTATVSGLSIPIQSVVADPVLTPPTSRPTGAGSPEFVLPVFALVRALTPPKPPNPFIVPTTGRIINVGPTRLIKTLAEASKHAEDGDTINVDFATYNSDVSTWTQNNIKIRGVGGRPLLSANRASVNGKAIFVISGDAVTIENIEFYNCAVPDKNGAGIRHEGGLLIVKNSIFRENENGILTGNLETQMLEIYNSQFIHNGNGVGYAHNLYVGQIGRLTVEGSYFTRSNQGHLLKSRAKENYIRYNRLSDETGSASYELDLPNGGLSYVVGNIIEQGAGSQNSAIINFGSEGLTRWANNTLYLSHNTIINNRPNGCRVVQVASGATVHMVNSVLMIPNCASPNGVVATFAANRVVSIADFTAPQDFNFKLRNSDSNFQLSNAVSPNAESVKPIKQYLHPAQTVDLANPPTKPGAIQ